MDAAARLSGEVIGADYSDAVEAAALVDLVHADIYALPFAQESCDAVVLHRRDPALARSAPGCRGAPEERPAGRARRGHGIRAQAIDAPL